MAQNYMMGAGMVPPPAPTPPSQLSFKGNPNQRMQFKNFMQGLSANQQAPVVPAMMPMPQIPIPMQNIDVFAQPVQFMQRGGITNRPVDEISYTPANVAKEKSNIQKALERREKARQMDDSNERRNFPKLTPTPTRTTQPITPEQESAARDALTRFAIDAAGGEDTARYSNVSDIINRFQPRRGISSLSSQIADLGSVPADFGAEFGTNQTADSNIRNLLAPGIGVAPVDSARMDPDLTRAGIAATFLDPRQSGLGTSLSEQISLLQGMDANIGDTNQNRSFPTETRTEIQQLDDEDKDATTVLKAIEPNFLSRLPGAVGDFFYKGQIDNFKKLASLPNFSYDNETGIGTVPVGSRGGELVLSPSGVITYRGQKDPNYSVDDPFATLIRPFERSSKSPSDPCPPGYVMINGACTPITQPATTATTPATPTPNVIQTTPVVTTPSPVVPSTAPPVQLGMPLGQTTPVQPMSQFFTNVPNSLNTAASNFLSALSS